MAVTHNPEEIEALADEHEQEAAAEDNDGRPALADWHLVTSAALRSFAALLREREAEEKLLDGGWSHSKDDLTGTPAHVWWKRKKDVKETDRHAALSRTEAARLALEKSGQS